MNESDLIEKEEVVETPQSEPTLRDTVAEAFDAEQAKVEDSTPTKPASESVDATPAPTADNKAQDSVLAKEGQASAQELKAPSQWKPAVREKWNALPLEVKQEVLRREGDSMRLIGSVCPKIRLADEITTHLQPFAERLQQNGVTPSAFIGDMFTSVKSLATGSPQDKAEVVANIVQSYGVDLKTLDSILSRRLAGGPEVEEARRLAARAKMVLDQQALTTQQQSSLEAERALAAFTADPKHEFVDDVRDLMADLIESGRASSLEDAYSAAIWANSDTRKILLSREAEARAIAKGGRAAQARRASSAVHGAPNSGTGGVLISPRATLRETIEAAFDEHSS